MSLPAEDVLLLHNTRCSKSRATKALLEETGHAFQERDYQTEPLDLEELKDLAQRLGRPVAQWLRRGEAAYGEAELHAGSTEEELLAAIAQHPILLERPIVIRGQAARVGRPPEAVLELFG